MGYFLLQNEARKLNHQEVVEEDKRLKLPANWEAKKARLEWELAEDQKKKVGGVWFYEKRNISQTLIWEQMIPPPHSSGFGMQMMGFLKK